MDAVLRALAVWAAILLAGPGGMAAYAAGQDSSAEQVPPEIAPVTPQPDEARAERPRGVMLWLDYGQEKTKPLRLNIPSWHIVAAWTILFTLCLGALGFRIHESAAQRAKHR